MYCNTWLQKFLAARILKIHVQCPKLVAFLTFTRHNLIIKANIKHCVFLKFLLFPYSSIGIYGLIGNLLSFITIVTMKKRNLFNNLLLTLTIFDTFFILNGGSFFVQRAIQFNNPVYNFLFPRVIYPLAGISMTGKLE